MPPRLRKIRILSDIRRRRTYESIGRFDENVAKEETPTPEKPEELKNCRHYTPFLT